MPHVTDGGVGPVIVTNGMPCPPPLVSILRSAPQRVITSAVQRLILDVLRDLGQNTLPLLESLSQGFDQPLIPLTPFCLRRCLGVRWQLRRDAEEKAREQRQHLHRDAAIAFEPLDLPCQQVETARESCFAAIGAVR